MLPQWPLVVTASMLQFPSNPAAIAGTAEQTIAKAVHRAKAHRRLLIMNVLIRVLYLLIREVPDRGTEPGLPVSARQG